MLSKRNAGTHLQHKLREYPREMCPTRKPSYGQAPIHDMIIYTVMLTHRSLDNCSLRGLTQHLTETDAEHRVKYWMHSVFSDHNSLQNSPTQFKCLKCLLTLKTISWKSNLLKSQSKLYISDKQWYSLSLPLPVGRNVHSFFNHMTCMTGTK